MLETRTGEGRLRLPSALEMLELVSSPYLATHHADVLTIAACSDGFDPGGSVAIAGHFHAVNRTHYSRVVAQQDMAELIGPVRG